MPEWAGARHWARNCSQGFTRRGSACFRGSPLLTTLFMTLWALAVVAIPKQDGLLLMQSNCSLHRNLPLGAGFR